MTLFGQWNETGTEHVWMAGVYIMRDVMCRYVCYAWLYAQAGRCYADMSVCRYGTLCGTGRRDGVRVRGMRYADMSGRASMRYAMAKPEIALESREFDEKWG